MSLQELKIVPTKKFFAFEKKTISTETCACYAWCENGRKSQPPNYALSCDACFQEVVEYDMMDFKRFIQPSKINVEKQEALYPPCVVHGMSPHETTKHRLITTNPDVIQRCWYLNENYVYEKKYLDVYQKLFGDDIPPLVWKFLKPYRLDYYGNVISLTADKNSLVGFDLDHKFPWSRGGRSKIHNLMCCQSMANRFIKRDELIPCLSATKMACGLQLSQLFGIVKYCLDSSDNHRGNLSNLLTKFVKYIETEPTYSKRSGSWVTFQKETNGSTDGGFLLSYFRNKEQKELMALGIIDVPYIIPLKKKVNRQTDCFPTIYLYRNVVEERIEIYGCHSFVIKKALRDDFDMSWDENKSCWWYYIPCFQRRNRILL